MIGVRERTRGVSAAVWVALTVVATAHAQSKPYAPDTVGIAFPSCDPAPFAYDDALAALRIELRLEGVIRVEPTTLGAATSPARIEIVAGCHAPADAVLVVIVDPRTNGASRATDLSTLPPADRARAIALVAAELARSVWTRPPRADEPPPAEPPRATDARPAEPSPVTVVPPPPSPPAAPFSPAPVPLPTPREAPSGRSTVGSSALGRLFLPERTPLVGAGVELAWRGARFGLDGLAGGRDDALGAVSLGIGSAWFGFDAVAREGPVVSWRVGPRAAGRIAAGVARTASTARATSAAEPYAEVGVDLGVGAHLGERLSADGVVQAGVARGLEIYADERRIAVLGGEYVGLRLGLTARP